MVPRLQFTSWSRGRVLMGWLAIGVSFSLAAPTIDADSSTDAVVLSMDSGWMRRDDTSCSAQSGFQPAAGSLSVFTDTASVLLWQVPVVKAPPFRVSGSPSWLRRCERPSAAMWMSLRDADDEGRIHLPDAGRLPLLTWSWTAAEEGAHDTTGRGIVSVGVTVTRRGTSQLREIGYVWSRHEAVGTWSTSERDLLAGMIKIKTARVVVRNGESEAHSFRQQQSIEADMRRLFGEKPGKLLRVYVKLHSGARKRVTAQVTDLRLEAAVAVDSPQPGSVRE